MGVSPQYRLRILGARDFFSADAIVRDMLTRRQLFFADGGLGEVGSILLLFTDWYCYSVF